MAYEELEVIRNLTGCGKPCRYLAYQFHGGGIPTSFQSSHYVFAMIAQSRYNWSRYTWFRYTPTRYTSVKREELLYHSSTMVAEMGGTLSLFLGVSFMTIWDGFIRFKKFHSLVKTWLESLCCMHVKQESLEI